MAVFYGIDKYSPNRGTSVALGFFDGVHLGHRAVIGATAADGLRRAALTFSESPARALGRPCPPLLTDNARKAELMLRAGAEDILFADFTALKDYSPEEFVKEILVGRLRARQVCCGMDYRFGRGGSGDTTALNRLCAEYGVEVRLCPPVTLEGEIVSSTRIRELLAAGDVARANAMLGSGFAIEGNIAGGNHIGSGLGFPTINLPIGEGLVVPRYGVYASRVTVGGETYIGATNIGVHPTAGANAEPLCESFLPDYSGGSLYGKRAVCELCAFVREERRFASLDELKVQIDDDCREIKRLAGRK